MKKIIALLLILCLLLTACGGGGSPQGQVDNDAQTKNETPAPQKDPAADVSSFDDVVKLLQGRDLYIRDYYFKNDFTNPSLLGYVDISQYAWVKFAIAGKDMTVGDKTYHLTGEAKPWTYPDGSLDIRFEAEEASCFLHRDKNGYWSLYCCEKGISNPVGDPYILVDQFTYWKGVEAWNKGYLQFKEKIDIDNRDGFVDIYNNYYFGINKDFYNAQLSGEGFNSVVVIQVEKTAENYNYTVKLSPDLSVVTYEIGSETKNGGNHKYTSLGIPVLPVYNGTIGNYATKEQYEEDGMIWFLVHRDSIGTFTPQEIEKGKLEQKTAMPKIKVSIYMNHFFLPKDYK